MVEEDTNNNGGGGVQQTSGSMVDEAVDSVMGSIAGTCTTPGLLAFFFF